MPVAMYDVISPFALFLTHAKPPVIGLKSSLIPPVLSASC